MCESGLQRLVGVDYVMAVLISIMIFICANYLLSLITNLQSHAVVTFTAEFFSHFEPA